MLAVRGWARLTFMEMKNFDFLESFFKKEARIEFFMV